MSTSPHPVGFHPDALAETRAAYEWYAERDELAAQGFIRALDVAVAVVAASPEAWPRFSGGTRRCWLRSYPYFVVYRVMLEELQVVAVAHAKRHPDYWRQR